MRVQPTPPAIPRDKGSSSLPRMVDRFTTMEKHRPMWARRLTATELDKRQEQARVMNHGHQILLESKLGKLDLREKRSVKNIKRKTENMLELLQNIQSSTPRLGSLERPGSSTSGDLGALTQSPADRRRLAPTDQQHFHAWEESSCGESHVCGNKSLTSPVASSTQDFHLPRLQEKPTTPKFNTRRRYSANDALTQSIEKFHAYKAHLSRFPSTETIEENDDDDNELPRNTPKSIFRNSRQKLHVDDNGVSYAGTRSISNSQNDTDMTESADQSNERSSHVSFKVQSGKSSRNQTPLPESIRKPVDEHTFPNGEIDAINSVNPSEPSTAPSISRSLSVLAPEFLPIIRTQTRSGKRPNKEVVDNEDDDENEENHVEGNVSIIVPFHHKTDRSLRMTRRQSLAVKPATFRHLDSRRKSSPDVLTSTITLNQKAFLRSRQMSTTSLPSSPRWNRSSDVDLNLKIKNFLDRTDTFIQSGERSSREEEELSSSET